MPDKQYTDITAIIDKSGSMGPLVESTIQGFNNFLSEQKGAEGKATLSLIQFDNHYEVTYNATDIQEVQELDTSTYQPRGTTALNDAVMRALTDMETRQSKLKKKFQPGKSVVVIITDGHENASMEFGGVNGTEQVQARIQQLQKDKDWQFAFFGANIDAKHVAASYGIPQHLAMNYTPDAAGVHSAYSVASRAVKSFRSTTASSLNLDPDDQSNPDAA